MKKNINEIEVIDYEVVVPLTIKTDCKDKC